MKRLLIAGIVVALSGCSTVAYEQYARSAEASNVARSKAIADIAANGSDSARVAAVMALALGAGQTTLQAPPSNEALQWASILVPSVTQVMGMRYNYLSQQVQSNNAAAVAISTNATMQGIAGQIQAPGAITTNTLSGTGTLGSGAYSTTDNHAAPAPVIVTPIVTPPVQITPTVITPVIQVTPVINTTP